MLRSTAPRPSDCAVRIGYAGPRVLRPAKALFHSAGIALQGVAPLQTRIVTGKRSRPDDGPLALTLASKTGIQPHPRQSRASRSATPFAIPRTATQVTLRPDSDGVYATDAARPPLPVHSPRGRSTSGSEIRNLNSPFIPHPSAFHHTPFAAIPPLSPTAPSSDSRLRP